MRGVERAEQKDRTNLSPPPSHSTPPKREETFSIPLSSATPIHPAQILNLQSRIGNQAVQRLIRDSTLAREGQAGDTKEKQKEQYQPVRSKSIETLQLKRKVGDHQIQRKLERMHRNPDDFDDWWYDDTVKDNKCYKIIGRSTTFIEVKEVDRFTGQSFGPSYYYDSDGEHRIPSPWQEAGCSSAPSSSHSPPGPSSSHHFDDASEEALDHSPYFMKAGGTLSATAEHYGAQAYDKFKGGTDEERLIPKDKQKLDDPRRLEKHARRVERIVGKARKEEARKERKREDDSEDNHLLSHASQSLDRTEAGIGKVKRFKDNVLGLPARAISGAKDKMKAWHRKRKNTTRHQGGMYKTMEYEQREQLGMGTSTKYMIREDNLLGDIPVAEGSSLDFYRTLQSRLPAGSGSKASREEASSFADIGISSVPGYTEGTQADNLALSNVQQGGGLLDDLHQLLSLKKEIRDLKRTIAEQDGEEIAELEESLTRLDQLESKLTQTKIDTGVDTTNVALRGGGQVIGPLSTAANVLGALKNIKNYSIGISQVSHHLAMLQAALNGHIEDGNHHLANIVAGVIHRLTKERRSLATKINTDSAKALASIGLFFAPDIAQKVGTAPIGIGESATRGVKKMRHKKKLSALHSSLVEALEEGSVTEADGVAAELITRDPIYLAQAIAEFFAAGESHPALEELLVSMGLSRKDFSEEDPRQRRAKILLLQQKLKMLGWWDEASKVKEERRG